MYRNIVLRAIKIEFLCIRVSKKFFLPSKSILFLVFLTTVLFYNNISNLLEHASFGKVHYDFNFFVILM